MSNQPADNKKESWDDDALRNPHARTDKAARVEAMFDAIAPTYERVNSVASFGRDAAWRRRAVAAAQVNPDDVVLDIACGTGDMIREFARSKPAPARIIGLDFAAGMLASAHFAGPSSTEASHDAAHSAVARGRADASCVRAPIELIRADALRLPLADASVNIISCAFGVRNFQDLQRGFREMHRVLRPGGRLVILEFSMPENAILRWPYRLYTEVILPRIGSMLSRDTTGAYRYLPKSIGTFEPRRGMLQKLESAGLVSVAYENMNLGGVVLYRAEMPR